MSGFCQRTFDAFRSSPPFRSLRPDQWYLVSGRAGPNAVLKMVIPASKAGDPGYVLTVARQTNTAVIAHEVGILTRLKRTLPEELAGSIPPVVAHGQIDERDYFALPFYRSSSHQSIGHRLARNRQARWVTQWVTNLARHTRGSGLNRTELETRYAETIRHLDQSDTISAGIKRRVRESFQNVLDRAEQIPTVCCHGDLWTENILWQGGFRSAVILDWGAAQWPGLPGVDLCRYALTNLRSPQLISAGISQYCKAIELDPALLPALYDVYNLFIKSESDLACATQPDLRFDPFTEIQVAPSEQLAPLLANC